MAQSQLRNSASAGAGPKFRRSSNFFFLRCFGFTGSKRKTNFKKKSPTDAITKRPHWFAFSTKKKNNNSKTHQYDPPPPLFKPSWKPPPPPNSQDESKLTLKDMEEECKNPSGRTDKSETVEKILSPPEEDHTQSIILPLSPSKGKEAKTNSRTHRKSKVMSGTVDSTVGFFIVTLNLVIMLVWGKVCAILCASGFLYIVPRFRTSVQVLRDIRQSSSGPSSKGKSDDSMIKKSKVVFDGFLERKRRSSFGHL
ncbi:uncharacterized protein At5g23160-like [Impatiens glandulifera]|uniref:uncharacterized protein At5g23160-like n=1 Tax=Impatiens glandulifera TaxID=253017 RepID=UPI001FB0649C|nr:uncharacterized protein At5g23160-like [Impatiens glandulifera]